MEQEQDQNEEGVSIKQLVTSILSIIICGVLGYVASRFFDWSAGWSIGIGCVIGWILPGFIEGAKEELSTLKEDQNQTKKED